MYKKLISFFLILISILFLLKTYYDKMHMFDVALNKKEKYFESKTFTAGKSLKTFNLTL